MTSCWGITDGSAGMVSQVRALCWALGITPDMKKVGLRSWYRWQPNSMYAAGFQHLILDYALDKNCRKELLPPWPDVVISCGRKGALAAMGVRYAAQSVLDNKTKFIHIQDPQAPSDNFDLVIAMAHDKITGENVLKTRFALHMITPQHLEAARAKFSSLFETYPRPHVAVLLGGSTNKYTLSRKHMHKVIASLKDLLGHTPGSLLITPSRRTGKHNVELLQESFAFAQGDKKAYLYDFTGDNPYGGMLALADFIIVTNDSVNMMSEAHATGKPLYILPLPGHRGTKPARFAEALIKDGLARPFTPSLESWNPTVSNEMDKIRDLVGPWLKS